MGDNTKIEWADHTFNPWIGCTKVGPGCDHCYASDWDKRWNGAEHWGPGAPRRRTKHQNWARPLEWNREAEEKGIRYRVFCASLADVFDNEVDPSWRADLFYLIYITPNLDWLLLTKRIGNAEAMMRHAITDAGLNTRNARSVWPNVWLGATFCNQKEWDRDADKLTSVPATVHFGSFEPLLGGIDLMQCPECNGSGETAGHYSSDTGVEQCDRCRSTGRREYLDLGWIISGGESGKNARPMHPEWVRSLRDQCTAAGIPFLFKQWGEWRHWDDQDQTDYLYTRDLSRNRFPYLAIDISGANSPCAKDLPIENEDSITQVYRVGKKVAGRFLDGRTWDEFPEQPQ